MADQQTPASPKAANEPPPKPKRQTDVQIVIAPTRGQVTYDSEGQEGGKFASRYLSVPSDTSGLTIGRGYDMKDKNASEIAIDLEAVGVSKEQAKTLSGAAGLSGEAARKFITDNKLEEVSLTPQQQSQLFDRSFRTEANEAKRLCTKKDVQAQYGACKWDDLDPAISDIVVDLKYRGDYTPGARAVLQKAIVENDLAEFTKQMGDIKNWANVPKDRFDRRKALLDGALAKKKQADALKVKKP